MDVIILPVCIFNNAQDFQKMLYYVSIIKKRRFLISQYMISENLFAMSFVNIKDFPAQKLNQLVFAFSKKLDNIY